MSIDARDRENSEEPDTRLPPRVLAVMVLFQQTAVDSLSFQAFSRAVANKPELLDTFSLLIYDNSPTPQASPSASSFEIRYIQDRSNPGLAGAYNFALKEAGENGFRWLLLLDQDTEVTESYLSEVAEALHLMNHHPEAAAIVPKLAIAGRIKSPTLDFLEWLRRQVHFRRRPLFADWSTTGLQQEQFAAFNSGAVLRVSSLEAIGGFPNEFWLDFLDVAVFHLLHRNGGRIFVLESCLTHHLSVDAEDFYHKENALARHRNILLAMARFVGRFGTPMDVFLNRLWLLRNAWVLFRKTPDRRFARESLRQAWIYRSTE